MLQENNIEMKNRFLKSMEHRIEEMQKRIEEKGTKNSMGKVPIN